MDSQNVLDAWRFLEMIQPSDLPKSGKIPNYLFSDNKERWSRNKMSCFQGIYEAAKPQNLAIYSIEYTYYINCYNLVDLTEAFRTYFKNEEDVINRHKKTCYSLSFKMDDKCKYIEGSLYIPHVHLVLFDINQKQQINYTNFIERYNNRQSELEEDAKTLFSNGVTETAVQQLSQKFYSYFDEPTRRSNNHFFEINMVKKDTIENKANFNSFYLDDLHTINQKNLNTTLRQFIKGKSLCTDIDQNQKVIEELLSPKNLPDGRWPSRIDHRLSLMQQVAVNQIINGNEPIYSVNGPPGTGKTTLLQDIFAHLIVERAKEMTKYANPTAAFTKIGKFKVNSTENKKDMYELNQNIAKYSMVVASSNNGAVENISNELPELNKIIRPLDTNPDKDETEEEKKKRLYINEVERLFAEETKKMNHFSEISSKLLKGKDSWGLFSVALGKRSNMNFASQIINSLGNNKTDDELEGLGKFLGTPIQNTSWEEVVKEFQKQLELVTKLKEKLQKFKDENEQYQHLNEEELNEDWNNLKKKIVQLREEYQHINVEKELLKEQISLQMPEGFLRKIKNIFRNNENEQIAQLKKEVNQLLERQKKIQSEIYIHEKKIKHVESEKLLLTDFYQMKNQLVDENLIIPDEKYWSVEENEFRQMNVPWQTHSLNVARSMLFLKAHKVFLMKNHDAIESAVYLFSNLKSLNINVSEQKGYIAQMWKTIHLLIPVQSATFASFSSMYKGIDQDFIDYLFIDEAGQASPQAAAGALWRSKKAIVVGDPIQIEPVITLDDTILQDIKQFFQVTDNYVGPSASVQVLADYANPIGAYKSNHENDKKERIGIPLWVHRRCLEPMFSIANEMAYDGKMVLAKKEKGKSFWFDYSGKAVINQYVEVQGKFIVEKMKDHFKESGKEGELPNVFIITPFTAVKDQLIQLMIKQLEEFYPNVKKWANNSIGTVHTFQGKEANIVYFVTGTDKETDSAANWSCQQPNLLNVAVTRAKKEFYIIGDIERFQKKQYYNIIHKHVGKEL